jgi:hypothetical protein
VNQSIKKYFQKYIIWKKVKRNLINNFGTFIKITYSRVLLTIIVSLGLLSHSFSQNTIDLTGFTNTNSKPKLAFSLRRLSSSFSGNLIKVRRSSDNREIDIGFNSSGLLDETSLLSWVGSGNGFVTTWYDQSGNNLNLSQTTTTQQPQIVSNGTVIKINNVPSLKSSVSLNTQLNIPNGVSSYTIGSVHLLGKINNSPSVSNGFSAFFQQTGGVNYGAFFNNGTTTIIQFGGGSGSRRINTSPRTIPSNLNIYSANFALGKANENNQTIGAISPSSPPAESGGVFALFNNPGSTYPLDGNISEFILFSSSITSSEQLILETNQSSYFLDPYLELNLHLQRGLL